MTPPAARRLFYGSAAALLLSFGVTLCSSFFFAGPGFGQSCGTDYVIKEGESLSDIAQRAYGNASQWTMIFYANQDRMGANVSLLVPGVSLRIPCLAGTARTASPPAAASQSPGSQTDSDRSIELSSTVKRIEFLTADGNAPFTDRSLWNGGLITQIVSASMDLIKDSSKNTFNYNVSWVNDWAAHLNPLLITRAFDAGFPWLKPDCERVAELSPDSKYRCQKFLYSDPIYEIFRVLYVKSNSTITFARDDELIGKTVCQSGGNSTYEFDKAGRNFVRDNKIVLLRPPQIEDCFRLLAAGSIDAVVTADLAGKAVVTAMGLDDKVKVLPRPFSIGTVHLIVSRTHPNASTILYYFNTALGRLRESGEYDRILEAQLSRFWNAQEKR